MVKAVLFDLDGTLLDRDASLLAFIDSQYERFKLGLGQVAKEEFIARFVTLDHKGYVSKDQVYKQLVNEFMITGISSGQFLQDYMGNFKQHCVPFPNLLEMLDELKGNVRLGMITNGKGLFQMDNIKALGIESYFDTILVSETEGLRKPDAEIFNRALARLDVLPDESIFVGDHPENDVHAAQRVGMQAIWKRDLYWDDAEADFIVEDLAEIPLVIRSLSKK